jgi:hypothetical protein
MNTIRCSSLPLFSICPQSSVPGQPSSTFITTALTEGSSLHARIKAFIEAHTKNFLAISAPDPEVAAALSILRDVLMSIDYDLYPVPYAEWSVSTVLGPSLTLTGTIDLALLYGNTVVIVDWKRGANKWSWYVPQLKGYAYLAMSQWGAVNYIVITVNVADHTYHVDRGTDHDLALWAMGVDETYAAITTNTTYQVGTHCSWCQRRMSCDAYQATLAKLVSLMNVLGDIPPEQWSRPRTLGPCFVEALDRMTMLSRAILEAKSLIRATLEAEGPLPIPGGEIALVATHKHTINTARAWTKLVDLLTLDELKAITKFSWSQLKKVYGRRAARGQKKAALEQLELTLKSIEALDVQVSYTTKTFLHKKEITTDETDDSDRSGGSDGEDVTVFEDDDGSGEME